MDEFEAEHKIQLDRPEVVKRMREEFLSRLSTLDEISPIAQIARERKGIVPMAVASGGARAIVTATLEATQLRPLFDEIVTMDDAIGALHFGSVRGDMTFISSTPGKIKKTESLGEPHYTAEDGCRAWVIKKP